jgi:hypothetical protein
MTRAATAAARPLRPRALAAVLGPLLWLAAPQAAAAQEPAADSLPPAPDSVAGAQADAAAVPDSPPAGAAAADSTPAGADSAAAAPADSAVEVSADSAAAIPADSAAAAVDAAGADSLAAAADSVAAADSLTAPAVPDSAARAAADSAAADSLERVRGDIRSARERLEEVGRVLADLPADEEPRLSPKGAVLRAFALPGWGQFYTGHRMRGFMYAGAEVGFATLGFLKQREVNDFKEEMQLARLEFVAGDQALHPDSAYSLEDTLALYDRFGTTPAGAALASTLEAKQRRREDFFTYAVFAVLFGAIDAFVSAHLDPYHEAEISASPQRDGGMRLDLTVPFGGGSRRR